MDNIEKVARFEEAINKAAENEIEKLLSDAKKKAEEIVKCADEEYLEKSYNIVSGETKSIERKLQHEVSQKEFEASKEVFAHRNKRVNDLFEELENEIAEFSLTPEYEKRLIAITEEIEKENPFDEKTVIYVKPADVDKLKKRYPKATVSGDKNIKLGGVSVFYPQHSVYADRTFDNAFAEQKAEFVNNKLMQL